MKTRLSPSRRCAGYALLMVLIIGAVSIIALAASMRRTSTVALLNDRNNQYLVNINAAEAAVEKVIARMSYDFQGGLALVTFNINSGLYGTQVPSTNENAYWGNFQFSNGQGQVNRTYVNLVTNYSGPLPSKYEGLFTINAPLYRVLSNVRKTNGRHNMTNAVQVDVLFALVPLSQYAIFYNGLLEFSTCAEMTVNGRTHANSNIYVGSNKKLTFNGSVTATGTIGSPANNGAGGWPFPGNVTFNGNPDYRTGCVSVAISLSMTNTHSLIDIPPSTESVTSVQGQQRLYNQAQVVLLVSNLSVTAVIQASPGIGQLPASDPAKTILKTTWTNGSSPATIQANLRTNGFKDFLTLTNIFRDQREDKDILVTQIDVGNYARWIRTNLDVGGVIGKFPITSVTYPTILYVADNRPNSASQLSAVRITNGIAPPQNGGLGWSVATRNPLYVWGNYNCPNSAHLASTNTTSTVPSAFMADALTILSSDWQDSVSFIPNDKGPAASVNITVNAAIIAGVKPSTGPGSSQFSGGVHNLPRLLEDWYISNSVLWLNTSIINLYNSTAAIGQFVTPSTSSYYRPPTRNFSFDTNFMDANKVPPGIPCALVPIRLNWATPPPNMVTYNVIP